MAKKKRKKYPNLPAGFGTIRYLGDGRRNPFAVHPPSTINELGKTVRPPALCYVDDYVKGFAVLTAYKAGTYKPGMERELDVAHTEDVDSLISRIIADYNTIKGVEDKHPEIKRYTFSEVFEQFLEWKFAPRKNFSKSLRTSYNTAFHNCTDLHNKFFDEIIAPDMQDVLDNCTLKRASIKNIHVLFKQMYDYAIYANIVNENKALLVKINAPADEENGVPFSDSDMKILWKHSSDPDVQMILILCYTGWRIGEMLDIKVNLEENYFQGGIKTKSSKNRIVPIHPAIRDFVKERLETKGCMLPITTIQYRKKYFYPVLKKIGLEGDPKHTPHDCRHTFSKLCEEYGVRENDRKRLMGHSFGKDITNSVYGHREIEDLRLEIEKIQVPFVTSCD